MNEIKTPTQHCRPGEGEKTCAYLMFGPVGLECSKGTSLQLLIENKLFVGEMKAKGNNCSGPPNFEARE